MVCDENDLRMLNMTYNECMQLEKYYETQIYVTISIVVFAIITSIIIVKMINKKT